MMPVILWTDALVFLLTGMVTAFFWYARRRRHLRDPWVRVLRRPLGMGSLVVVLAYVTVGLLDSVHFRPALPDNGGGETHYAGETLSLLDQLLGPVRTQVEKSYSAPFASHLYQKENIERPDGTQVRDYPRLRFGGAHLADPEREFWPDVRHRLFVTLAEALAATLLAAVLLAFWLARRHRLGFADCLRRILAGRMELPWRTALVTLGAVLVVVFFALNFAAAYHVLGTDKVGQDVFYQTLKSIRTGLVIGTLTTLVMLPFALLFGIMAGYFRGWVDDLIQYLYTTLSSIPGVLLIAASILILDVYMANHPDMFETMAERADLRLLFLCIILGIMSWTGLCRLLRGEAFKLREVEFVQAAQAFGVPHRTVLTRHLLPNVMHIVLISVVLDFSGLVLAEAVLSYIGVGVDPTMIYWGNMINRARLEMAREPMVWWSLLAAFAFMFTLVLAANLLADVVRDAFDPRLRRNR